MNRQHAEKPITVHHVIHLNNQFVAEIVLQKLFLLVSQQYIVVNKTLPPERNMRQSHAICFFNIIK